MYKKLLVLALLVSATSYAEKSDVKFESKLNDSVITTERYEGTPLLENNKNVTIITADDFKTRGYKSIEEALQLVPSLNLIDGQISVRGQVPKMGDKTLVVLLDGVPQNSMDNRTYDLDFIPLDQVKQIEVVPAGGTIMYGGNASAGLINIVTKDAPNEKYWGNVTGKLGSYEKREAGVNVGTKVTEKLDASIGYVVDNKKGFRDGEKKDVDSFEVKTTYNLEDGKVTFKYNRNKKTGTGRANALTKSEYEANRKQNKNATNDTTDTQDKYVLSFSKAITPELETSGVVEYRERDYDFSSIHVSKMGAGNGAKREKNTDSFYTNVQMKYKYMPNSNFIVGGDYSKAEVKEKSYKPGNNGTLYQTKDGDIDYKLVGGYLKNKTTYDKFIFTQGIRIEKNKFDENNLVRKKANDKFNAEKKTYSPTNTNFELATSYLLDKDKSIYVSFNQIKRTPNLTEYSSWDNKLFTDKKAQTTNNLEIGTKLAIDNIYLSAATFYTRTKDEIMYDPSRKGDKETGGVFYNLEGTSERIGVELSSEQSFSKLSIRENLTYMHNEVKSGKYKGKEIPGFSNFIVGLGATYEPIDNLLLNAETRFLGKHYYANDFENKFEQYPGYALTNISIKYNFDNGLSVYSGIDNLFDKKYAQYSYIQSKAPKYSPGDERTYYVGFDYNF